MIEGNEQMWDNTPEFFFHGNSEIGKIWEQNQGKAKKSKKTTYRDHSGKGSITWLKATGEDKEFSPHGLRVLGWSQWQFSHIYILNKGRFSNKLNLRNIILMRWYLGCGLQRNSTDLIQVWFQINCDHIEWEQSWDYNHLAYPSSVKSI